jgi:hypothetical protein
MLSLFRDFEPTDQVQNYLNFIVRQVGSMLPKAVATTTMLVRQGSRYLCCLEFETEGGSFKASSHGGNPIVALDRARRQLLDQVGEWRSFAVLEAP